MKKFFKKIYSFIAMLFVNVNAWINEHVQPSLEFVEKVKQIVDNPLLDVITSLIPSTTDDKVLTWARLQLPRAIEVLQVTEAIQAATTIEEKMRLLVEYLRSLSPEMRKGAYMRLASVIARTSGNTETVRGTSVDMLVQAQYTKMAIGVAVEDIPYREDWDDNNDGVIDAAEQLKYRYS